jgi:hypothetical protein
MKGLLAGMCAGGLVGLLAMAPVAEAGSGPGPVKYVPLTVSPRPGVLKPGAVRQHTLVIAPLYASKQPDIEAMRKMGASAKTFWEKQVPGLRLTVKYLPPHRLATACARIVNSAWDTAVKLARINPYTTGNHVLAYAPECNMNGLGSQRNGSGLIYIGIPDPDGSMLAHEFGHNLGLLHANVLECKAGGTRISLARTCIEHEYSDWTSVMGNGPLGSGVRVGGLGQALLTGRVTTLDAKRGGTATLSSTPRGLQAASLKTSLGILYFSTISDRRLSAGSAVVAEVMTRRGSGAVIFPEVPDRSDQADGILELGNHWNIPGSSLRVTVTASNEASATLAVSPAGAPAPPPAPAVVTMPAFGQYPTRMPWTLSWTPSPTSGVVAYFVKDQRGTIVARVDGKADHVTIPDGSVDSESDDSGDFSTLTIVAVAEGGSQTTSAPIRVTPVSPELSLVSSTGPSDEVVVTAPFTLSWSITPMYAANVTTWTVEYAGKETSLPAGQTSIVVDPALREDPDGGEVRVTANDSAGQPIESNAYRFYTTDWWS